MGALGRWSAVSGQRSAGLGGVRWAWAAFGVRRSAGGGISPKCRSRGGLGHFGRRFRSAWSGTSVGASVRRGRALRSASARAAARLLSSSRSVALLACSVGRLPARAAVFSLLASSFASPCVLLASLRCPPSASLHRLPRCPPSASLHRLPRCPPSAALHRFPRSPSHPQTYGDTSKPKPAQAIRRHLEAQACPSHTATPRSPSPPKPYGDTLEALPI